MRAGSDGFGVLRDAALEAYDEGSPLEDVLADHIAARGRVEPALDGRIARR